MDIEHIRCFLTVAETHSYSQAAEKLNVQSSVVSAALQHMDMELGTRCFERDNERADLTAAGELIYPHFVKILDEYRDVLKEIGEGSAKEGRVYVGSIFYGLHERLTKLIHDFAAINPDVLIDVKEDPTIPLIHEMERRQLDVIFVSSMHTEDEPAKPSFLTEDMKWVRVFLDKYSIILPKNHELAGHVMLEYEDLKNMEFASTVRTMDVFHEAVEKAFQKHNLKFKISAYCRDVGEVLDKVRTGSCAAILPALALKGNTEGLAVVPIRNPLLRETYMITRGNEEPTEVLRRFCHFIHLETDKEMHV